MKSAAPPPTRTELGRITDRWSFVYVERCVLSRDANAITAHDAEGVVHIPVAMLGCLMLGPGTKVSHAAIALLGDSGASVVWVGESGVRFYAGGRSLSGSAKYAIAQAKLVSTTQSRLRVARRMYEMRFPDEVTSGLTMQQLRGKEGARVRRIYREHSDRTGIPWSKRDYKVDDIEASDDINKALTVAHSCLYGVVSAVIAALGCIPSLGFIHNGHDRAFVFDIADLYKADVTIPAAFDVVASNSVDVLSDMRREVRDRIVERRLIETIAKDVSELLLPGESIVWDIDDTVSLWTGRGTATVPSGVGYS